jgi:hypothetical protein
MLKTASICHVDAYRCKVLLLCALVQVRVWLCVPPFAVCIAVMFSLIKPTGNSSVEVFNVATHTAASTYFMKNI